jgi:hypothetical protein
LTKPRRFKGYLASGFSELAWNFGFCLQVLFVNRWTSRPRDQQSMQRAQPASIFNRGWMARSVALAGIVILCVLAAPARSPGQDAGVSGIPLGPGNARGLNGSVNDPSGIGNAARVPAIPPPSMAPVTPPTASPPVAYRALPVQGTAKVRRTRFAASRWRGAAARATVRKRGKLFDHGVLSICRGC